MKRLSALVRSMLTASGGRAAEQAVIIHFQYGSTDLSRMFALEDNLIEAIASSGAGEMDGHEIAADAADGYFYMYGPSADRLYQVVKPILRSADFVDGAEVKLRYGPANSNAREVTFTFDRQGEP